MNRQVAAEAALWVAKLHGPGRSAAMDRDFKAWLAASDAHQHAFERCTEVWQEVPRLSVADACTAVGRQHPAAPRRAVAAAAAVAAVAAIAVASTYFQSTHDTYGTGIGEYRQVLLADGSRLHLNATTRLKVALDEDMRTVEVQAGEALFEVAKDPARPFVVRAGAHEVRALGTVFVVRRAQSAPDAMSVTLIEGKVEVTAVQPTQAMPSPIALEPGQRIQAPAAGATLLLDRPRLDQATAWTRMELALEDVALDDAVSEVNRHGRRLVALADDPTLRDLRVSGVFRAGDSEGFARAVSALHGLEVRDDGARLVIQAAGSHGD